MTSQARGEGGSGLRAPTHWLCPSLLPGPRPTQEAEAGWEQGSPSQTGGLATPGPTAQLWDGDQNPPRPRPAGWSLEHREGLQDLRRPVLIQTVSLGEGQTREPSRDA